MIAGQFLATTITAEEAAGTMGTARPVAATGERCPACNGRDLTDHVDAIGRVHLSCACGWRDDGQRRAAPSEAEMRALAYPPGALASLAEAERDTRSEREHHARTARLTREAERLADAIPTEWTPLRVIERDLGMDGTRLSNLLTRMLSAGAIERELRPWRDKTGRERKIAMVRRRPRREAW